MAPPKRLSDVVATENVESIAASLRKYGYDGPERPSAVARWLEAQGEDVNTPVAEAKKAGRERRPGQDAFRRTLLLAYEGRCALTECDVEPALEAAHVADWRSENDVGAGILLRADLHKLFDAGLLVIGRRYTVVAVPPWYRALQGRSLRLPKNRLHWPRLHGAGIGDSGSGENFRKWDHGVDER